MKDVPKIQSFWSSTNSLYITTVMINISHVGHDRAACYLVIWRHIRLSLLSWRNRKQVPLKHWWQATILSGITSQNTAIFKKFAAFMAPEVHDLLTKPDSLIKFPHSNPNFLNSVSILSSSSSFWDLHYFTEPWLTVTVPSLEYTAQPWSWCTLCYRVRPLIISHFNTIVSNIRDWFWQTGMGPCGCRVSFPNSLATA